MKVRIVLRAIKAYFLDSAKILSHTIRACFMSVKSCFFIPKAYLRPWLARTFLYRKDTDKHEFSRLLSPTLRELGCLIRYPKTHRHFQLFLIDCRNKVGHHGKYDPAWRHLLK